MSRSPSKSKSLPTKQQLIDHIEAATSPPSRRELQRAFKIGAGDRAAFKQLLSSLYGQEAGRSDGRSKRHNDRLPRVTVIEVAGTDDDGEVLARPVRWESEAPPPRIYLAPGRRGGPAPGTGDRLLARLSSSRDGSYRAEIIRQLEAAPSTILGVYMGGGRVRSTDRKWRDDLKIADGGDAGAEAGELVVVRPLPGRRMGPRTAEITERLGVRAGPKSFSLMAIHNREIPHQFTAAAEALAAKAQPVDLADRTDIRALPLVTIDDKDARDFDDAVWAEPDPEHTGGWHVVVAIADVSWYVRPGDAIDLCAQERGNSAYFPDRVVPMLPEALSNELCSLKPGEDRPCLVAHLWLDHEGQLTRHKFERALMRSAARLTYEQVQAAHDGTPDETTHPVYETTVAPLFEAYAARLKERQQRQPLELEFPEKRIELDSDGDVIGIGLRPRLTAHRLIEEFMILANVATAETLIAANSPCLFRIHAPPREEGLEELREQLTSHDLRLAKGQVSKPAQFNWLLNQLENEADRQALQMSILRAQSLAVYESDNIGHFGLALRDYAHFTSPIRRYADLLVHRALISTTVGGAGGSSPDHTDLKEIGAHISMTERRAAGAERDASDKFAAAFLAGKIGEIFEAEISGVTKSGVFVQLAGLGIDGFLPGRFLPRNNRGQRRRPGDRRRSGKTSATSDPRIGQQLTVRLREVDPPSGSIVVEPA